jgi:6-phosphofructokinase
MFLRRIIRYFFYNGGGDSADTCLKVSQISKTMGYPIHAIHIPKTIDNDLPLTDCSPGFGSVAKYVATSTLEAGLDIAAMSATSTKIFILEVMGRHARWIAATSGLAAQKAGQPPHIILFPEVAFDRDRFIDQVKKTVKSSGYCVAVASEGVTYADGGLLSGSLVEDAFGHQQLGG